MAQNGEFVYDKFISKELFSEIMNEHFQKALENASKTKGIDKGAGSFCTYIEHNGEHFALLTPRAEKLVLNALKGVTAKANQISSIVPVYGVKMIEDAYGILMPRVMGSNLPSKVEGREVNIARIKNARVLTQRHFDLLARDSYDANNKRLKIDFHGGNFIIESIQDTISGTSSIGDIKIIDVKKTSQYNEQAFLTRIIRLFNYNSFQNFKDNEVLERIANDEGVNVTFEAARNVIMMYTALSGIGIPEESIDLALKNSYKDSNGEFTISGIDDLLNVTEDTISLK